MRQVHMVIEKKDDNLYHILAQEKGSFDSTDRPTLNGPTTLLYIITNIKDKYIVQRKDYFANKVIDLLDTFDEVLDFCKEGLKERYADNSYVEFSSKSVLLNHKVADLRNLYQAVYDEKASFDVLNQINEEYDSIINRLNNKIDVFVANYIEPLKSSYENRKRTSEAKIQCLHNIVNNRYSSGYLRKLYDNLVALDNLILKDEEIVVFIETEFFEDFSKLSKKNSFYSMTQAKLFYKNVI